MTFIRLKQRSLGLLVSYFTIFSLLLGLGFWQLNRAEQKRALASEQVALMSASPLMLADESNQSIANAEFRLAVAKGYFDYAHQFILDNQHFEGKVGYFVLTPLRFAGTQQAILVNRGWLPAAANRSLLPDVTVTADLVNVQGRLNHFPGVGFKLAGAEQPTATWPALVQVVDIKILAEKLGYALLPLQLELAPDQAHGYARAWQTTVKMPPEQHVAYAVQWFGLALTFTVLFIWFNNKKNIE